MRALDFFDKAAGLYRGEEPFVVVTQVQQRGEAPSDPGSKAIIQSSGLVWGTVGGGKIEARAIQFAKEILTEKQSEPLIRVWNLQTDIGMTCGGEVTFLFEVFSPRTWNIAVFGAGHIAQELVRTLLPLQCRLWCTDSRSEWIEKLPQAENLDRLVTSEPVNRISALPQGTFFVVMTQGHATDVPILDAIFRLHSNSPYIGVIGSDLKAGKIRRELKARGIEDSLLERLRCPMGLKIGNNQPVEIAISITSELLQVRDQTT